jgi:tetratricopeptide (TPR) repeat protein
MCVDLLRIIVLSWLATLLATMPLFAEPPAAPAKPAKTTRDRAKPVNRKQPATMPALGEALRPAIDAALHQLQSDGDFAAAQQTLSSIFDQVVAYADTDDKALFTDAAFALRLVRLLATGDDSSRRDLLEYLLANPDLARALAFLVKPGQEKPAEVLGLLNRLRASHPNALNTYANLATALCVVHHRRLPWRIKEMRRPESDPVPLFEYFVANEKRMLFGIRTMPAELLIYVVDSTASVPEMQWALQRYAGDTNVGARFFDIDYDYDYFVKGAARKVSAVEYTLPNILKFGGVCADQAYFAASAAKAIGVPSACAVGASAEVSHGWVGFVQADSGRAWWNFDSGRYPQYQGVRGSIIDPQTGQSIPDSYVSLLADFVGAKTADRQAVVAMTDAARRLIEMVGDPSVAEAESIPGFESAAPRARTTDEALALLEAGLGACPGYGEAWFTVQQLAQEGRLSLEDKKRWGGVLHRLCGERYPDFYLAIITPMIATIDDVKEQNALWNAAFKVFQNRHDLAATVRIEQAKLWLAQQEFDKAGQCFEDVINRYANAGPFVIEALSMAEAILRQERDGRRLLALYQRAWSQINKPQEMAGVFVIQSNWYRVGTMYAERLEEAGARDEAAKVRAAIGLR